LRRLDPVAIDTRLPVPLGVTPFSIRDPLRRRNRKHWEKPSSYQLNRLAQ
jgi:hypothetical protein